MSLGQQLNCCPNKTLAQKQKITRVPEANGGFRARVVLFETCGVCQTPQVCFKSAEKTWAATYWGNPTSVVIFELSPVFTRRK